jgi:hypothetical protein
LKVAKVCSCQDQLPWNASGGLRSCSMAYTKTL